MMLNYNKFTLTSAIQKLSISNIQKFYLATICKSVSGNLFRNVEQNIK